MYGYMNRLLTVDLTTGYREVIPLSPEYVRDYIGGRGLGARYLYDLLQPETDPLSPENVALLMTGPFTGTEAYSCHKYEWVTKSPLTGTYLCSNCGGMLGVNLRKAGYDGLLIRGAAEHPLYDDRLPLRILEEPLRGGDYDGVKIGRRPFERMLTDYYALRGWDSTGIPPANGVSRDKLQVAR